MTLGAILAVLPLHVAVSARTAWCALGAAFRTRGLAGITVRAVGRLGSIADFANRTLVAFQQPRLIAELAGQAWQARRLTLRVLVEAFRTIIAGLRIIIVSCSVLAFVAILTRLTLHVAVSARAARRTLGAAFRIGGFAGVTVRAVSRLRRSTDLAYRTLVAFQQPRLVAKLAGQARQTRRLALRVLVEAFRTIVARRGIGIVSCSVLAFVAILAILSLRVAVSACPAWCALGAAFRIGRLAS